MLSLSLIYFGVVLLWHSLMCWKCGI